MVKNKFKLAVVGIVTAVVLAIAPAAVSYADGTVTWSGQGVSNGQFDTTQCSGDTPSPGDVLWVFTATGADSATITINGQTSNMTQEGNGAFHFVQTGFNGDFATLTASATFSGDSNSNNPQLVISHGCPATGGQGGGPTKDCDNDFDNSPASECATGGGGQVLGATTGTAQVQTPKGGVGAGLGGASQAFSRGAAIGLGGSLLSLGSGLALLNRRKA